MNNFEALRIDILQITDPRDGHDVLKHHLLFDIIVIGLCCKIVGGEGFTAMHEFGLAKEEWLKTFLELPNGIPSTSTFRRIFSSLNPDEFSLLLGKYASRCAELIPREESIQGKRSIAIDGKTHRGSQNRRNGTLPLHTVAAFDTERELTIGEVKVDDKSNEITAIPALLKHIDVKGAVVTIDAMGCQKQIAHCINKAGAGFVLALKGNHGDLHSSVKGMFSEIPSLHELGDETGRYTVTEAGHGRIETRTCLAIEAEKVFGLSSEWPTIRSFIAIEATRELDGKESTERRFFISDENPDSQQLAHYIRRHWEIENKLHWVLDVTFREDASRTRFENAQQNIGILKRLALNLIKSESSRKLSKNMKRFRAGLVDSYLAEILFQSSVLSV